MFKRLATALFSVLMVLSAPLNAAEQKAKDVLLIMSSHASKPKGELLALLAKDQAFNLDIYSTKGKSEEDVKARWQSADLIMLDGINPALSAFMFGKYQAYLQEFANVPVISLGDLDNDKQNQGLSTEQKQTLGSYYKNAGRDNYANMMDYLSVDVFSLSDKTVAAPRVTPNVGLYHYDFPGAVTADENAFFQFLAAADKQPIVAIGMHRSVVDYEQTQIVDAIIKGLEAKGAKALGYFFEGNDEALNYTDLLQDEQQQTRVDLLINYRSLHYVDKRRGEFEKLGVPIIHALNYNDGDEQSFNENHTGVSPSLTPFFLVMPEDTGSTDPTIIAANANGEKVIMQDQLNALVERAYNHANLAHIAEADKKVATFIWNYPPGEKNIGAAFLDVPSSIEQIAMAMKAGGYQVNVKDNETLIAQAGLLLRPYYRNEDSSALIDKGLADYLPLNTYLAWFNSLPENVQQPIVERWGNPGDSNMVTEVNGEKMFVIPRMELGNMIVLPQGVRGENPDEHASLYHSTKTPVTHGYLAIYLYVREVFDADAYIHLGTHGSQEWLTGKERGLSVWDAPNLAIGNLPVFYPYIIDNVGEAMQAKRRGRATMISHLTPGFAKAGLYADVAKLNELITNYMMLEQGQTRANTEQSIKDLATELSLFKDLGVDPNAEGFVLDDAIAKMQDHLNDMAQQSQPLGVHTFGLLPKEAHLFSTIIQMLGDDFAERAAAYEKANSLAVAEENRLDERQVVNLEALDGFQLLKRHLLDNKADVSLLPAAPDTALAADLELAENYWHNFDNIAEISNLLLALDAGYIGVSHGGDPIRNPDAAPTGRNLIGFNPAKVPSKEAYQAGVKLMDQTIEDYYGKHGKYPDKLAFSLWSLETMRHQGALEAQILHAMGVKPVWNRAGNVSGIEVIPYSELGRPRVDVVISATGLYRDAFPNVMIFLAKAIDEIGKLKEENNFVYRHANALKKELLDSGKSIEDAEYLSTLRIFSNETGNYGTGLAGASLDSDSWEDDSKLANLYLDRMGYAFGKDESRWSENVTSDNLYAKVLSGTDGVVFSRSTNLYALMTNDDPFQYFGGIGLAVRHLDGETPEMYVSNLRRKDNVKAQTMEAFLNQEMRSRYFHPRWIQAMQGSGYAGATAILDRMNNMWGWEVMTPDAVRDDHWQEFFEVYVNDKYELDMREFFEQHNAETLAQMLERMLEAVRKGYWDADKQTLQTMVETYTELATEFDVATDNEKFKEFMDNTAAGFGLTPLTQALAEALAQVPPIAAAEPQMEQVTGQKLEQTEVVEHETDYRGLYLLLLVILLGFISNYLQRPPSAPARLPKEGNKVAQTKEKLAA
ncbi:cobaltochelatase subunit CobN [Thalassotalea litorea]|uniref:Cobaltochelatase subunit CobN n=1 Tax=Thalassotalea litorea TaxID=2020715 RepID=A0A5R9INS4_9GAMM|nr:cobaltochelatase subunit CobN [Thalassotalea litorea]TLU67194.1 cobaltochelatase subunit CobN [Thalassotalea litorea]